MLALLRAVASASAVSESMGMAVLVVEDYEDNRALYMSVLADAGYAVEEAVNGQEALDKIAAKKPRIVIMDLSMPVMDGWEATRRIKANVATSDIIVIALTGHATNHGLTQARAAGADAVLAKPCLPDDLIALMRAFARAL